MLSKEVRGILLTRNNRIIGVEIRRKDQVRGPAGRVHSTRLSQINMAVRRAR
jgi:hypothetical protein